MVMFARFKKFTLVVLVPAVVGLGVWAQWTTLATKFAMLGTSAVESIPEEIATDGVRPYARTADPEPAPVPDWKPEIVTVEPVQPPAATINTEPAKANPAEQASPIPAGPKVKRLPFAIERRPENGAAAKPQAPAQAMRIDAPPVQESPVLSAPEPKSEVKPAIKAAPAAEPQSVEKASSAIKAPETTKPQGQEKPTPKSAAKSEAKSEVKAEVKPEIKPEAKDGTKDEAKDATKTDDRPVRKENTAKREKAEQATQSRTGRSASRERSQRSSDPDDFNPRRALTELRRSRSVADFYDRLEALGWSMR
jgi:hypothetical protein